ncbi:MAG: hypothetical protein RL456_2366 [Pseudomonadota bacterium]|jgi:membrane protease YdiL (CAAX protease family)
MSGGWPVAVMLLGVAPVAEEIVFRAGLQEGLLRRGWGGPASVLATAAAFGAAHLLARGGGWLAAATALPALALGAVYLRGRRVAPCVALHAAMNGAWMACT